MPRRFPPISGSTPRSWPSVVPRSLVRAVTVTVPVLLLLFAVQALAVGLSGRSGDVVTYLSAGERLNAGHHLYQLGPGDRSLVPAALSATINAPLLSPPPVAILWRPLALFGDGVMPVWSIAAGLAYALSVAWVVWRFPPALLALLPFLDGYGWAVAIGNVNAFLAPGILGIWKLRGRPWIAAALVVTLAAMKLWPAPLVLWLARDRRTWLPIAITTLGWLIACQLLAPGSISEYLGVARASGGPAWSVAILGCAATLVLPSRYAFLVAVWTGLLASPFNGLYWPALGILGLAPWTDRATPAAVADMGEPTTVPAVSGV